MNDCENVVRPGQFNEFDERDSVKDAMEDVVDYLRDMEETDFILEGGDKDHIVHSIRRLMCERYNYRWPGRSWSNKMDEFEFDQYAQGRCTEQVNPAARGRDQYCQEEAYAYYRVDTDWAALYCEEHYHDRLDGH
jgi:hypothetical protein